jgi:hypothetical protein
MHKTRDASPSGARAPGQQRRGARVISLAIHGEVPTRQVAPWHNHGAEVFFGPAKKERRSA